MSKRNLTFRALRAANTARCEKAFHHKVNAWTPERWACATAGECGEACNAVKKLNRFDDETESESIAGYRILRARARAALIAEVGKEIADTVIYADLLAARLGIDLSTVIRAKFNEVSDRRKCTIKL